MFGFHVNFLGRVLDRFPVCSPVPLLPGAAGAGTPTKGDGDAGSGNSARGFGFFLGVSLFFQGFKGTPAEPNHFGGSIFLRHPFLLLPCRSCLPACLPACCLLPACFQQPITLFFPSQQQPQRARRQGNHKGLELFFSFITPSCFPYFFLLCPQESPYVSLFSTFRSFLLVMFKDISLL